MKNDPLGPKTDEWIRGRILRRELKSTTAEGYQKVIRQFATFIGRDRMLRTITRQDIEAWIEKEAPKLAISSLRGKMTVVRLFFQWATDNHLIDRDPTFGIKMPKRPRSVPRGLGDQLVDQVLAAAEDTREYCILTLMLCQGLRAMEVAGLEFADIDRQNRTLHIHGKGDHERLLPLAKRTEQAISDYVRLRGKGSGKLIQPYKKSIWNDEDGMKAHSIVVIASRAFKRAEVDETGHALRHTFAHRLIDAGANLRNVQDALGHVSLMSTQVYLPRAGVAELRVLVEAGSNHQQARERGRG